MNPCFVLTRGAGAGWREWWSVALRTDEGDAFLGVVRQTVRRSGRWSFRVGVGGDSGNGFADRAEAIAGLADAALDERRRELESARRRIHYREQDLERLAALETDGALFPILELD